MPFSEPLSRRYSTSSLPASAYDGSHLQWQAFRWNVLAPYRIRILECPPHDRLPTELLGLIEAHSGNTTRFDKQMSDFKAQVQAGRGFGASPLFPPNLLPPIDKDALLSRCMIPRFSREALPERAPNQKGAFYELSVPRPGLGCGFSKDAFDRLEFDALPTWLVTTGTIVQYDTGYVSPGAAVYCPFLIFERTRGAKSERLEAANNQCAIAGSSCVRALRMLYNVAYKGNVIPELPVSFSCTIDNGFAIINYHWIDHGEAYCMAPLCKFDLTNDRHFSKFLVWVEAIGAWGVKSLLPKIKDALRRLREAQPSPLLTPKPQLALSIQTETTKGDILIRALKTTFDHIPWKVGEDDFTPVSSSTASWGSPMGDVKISSVDWAYPRPNLATKGEQASRSRGHDSRSSSAGSADYSPPPEHGIKADLVHWKRLSHAMDEIRDLQGQLQALRKELSGVAVALQNDVSGMKSTLSTVLRKENLRVRSRSIPTEAAYYPVPPRRSPLAEPDRARPVVDAGEKERCLKVVSENTTPPEEEEEEEEDSSRDSKGGNRPSLLKWTAVLVSGHAVGLTVSAALLRILLVGYLADLAIRTLASSSPSIPALGPSLLLFFFRVGWE